MEIRELSSEELDYVAAVCLDPSIPPNWREAMKPDMNVRVEWLKSMMHEGLRVSVAVEKPQEAIKYLDPENAKFRKMVTRGYFPKGLIEYVPIEHSSEPVKGGKSLFINCMWVVPPFWHHGVARALLERVIEKARTYGGLSVLAYEGDKWFGFFPYMPANFFRNFRFKVVDRDQSRVLLYLNLGKDEQPTLIKPKCKTGKETGNVVVDVFYNSQCPWSGWMADRIKEKVRKHDTVVNIVNTDDRAVVEEYGMSRGLCINGKPVIKRMASWKEIEQVVKQAVQH
nr:GNAT family N-acetyltransferase [Candidatus Njordarchaeota archaeon]